MDFNSLLFLVVFLPLAICLFHLVRMLSKGKTLWPNLVLLALSLFFYIYKGGFINFAILFGTTLLHFLMCYLIDRHREKKTAKVLLIVDLVVSVGLLVFFKYCNLFDFGKGIAFPLALSFVTFHTISFTVDIYTGKVRFGDVSILSYLLYVFLFIKLTQGPITPYTKLNGGDVSLDSFAEGMERFCLGLAKKILIADILAVVVSKSLASLGTIGTGLSWLAIFCFALQLFFDFSGYTDMAIGIGLMFGYRILENFNVPYISTSIRDFWRRWHMTLGAWFKDYVYIPLGGNRKGQARTLLNLGVVFILTGLWHGSTWNFLLWGVFFGVFMVLERLFLGKLLDKNPVKIVNWVYAMFVVLMGWVLFVSGTLENAGLFYRNLFSAQANTSEHSFLSLVSLQTLLALIAGVLFSTVVPLCLDKFWAKRKDSTAWFYSKAIIGLVLLAVCFVYMTSNNFSPSLYGGF